MVIISVNFRAVSDVESTYRVFAQSPKGLPTAESVRWGLYEVHKESIRGVTGTEINPSPSSVVIVL